MSRNPILCDVCEWCHPNRSVLVVALFYHRPQRDLKSLHKSERHWRRYESSLDVESDGDKIHDKRKREDTTIPLHTIMTRIEKSTLSLLSASLYHWSVWSRGSSRRGATPIRMKQADVFIITLDLVWFINVLPLRFVFGNDLRWMVLLKWPV
jgi:hypothetical protein